MNCAEKNCQLISCLHFSAPPHKHRDCGPLLPMHAITAAGDVKGYAYPLIVNITPFGCPYRDEEVERTEKPLNHDPLHILEDGLLELTLDLGNQLAIWRYV